MSKLKTIIGWLSWLEAVIAVLAFSACAAVLFADVVGREIFGHGVFWAQRVAVYCATFAGLLGFVLVVESGDHLRASTFDKLVPTEWDRVINRLADLTSAAICLFIAAYAFKFVRESFLREEHGVAIDIVVWPLQTILPYAFASAAIRYLAYAAFPTMRPIGSKGH